MCGIVGMFCPSGIPGGLKNETAFDAMLGALDHRGPDGKGVLYHDKVWLGHARLSIIDLESGQQPMALEEDGIYIVFNGEVFNYIELREELVRQGAKFKTTSDTEVLLHLYKRDAEAMLDQINGQFAFCIWDKNANKIFLARDHVGILPLFYTQRDGTLFFASSIKSLLHHPSLKARMNHSALKSLCSFWVPIEGDTFFEDVFQLDPGECLTLDARRLSKRRYWDPSFPQSCSARSTAEWIEATREALSRAVRLRLRADVPVGCYLSGGLDSSVLAALAAQEQPEALSTFSIAFSDRDYDESDHQRTLVDHYGLDSHTVSITPELIATRYKEMIIQAEQPVYRTAPVPLHYLSEIVHQNDYKVVLSGEGADEIAWGYNIFKETAIRRQIAEGVADEVWQQQLMQIYPYLQQFEPRYSRMMMEFYRKQSNTPDDPLFSHLVRMQNGGSAIRFMTQDMQKHLSEIDSSARLKASLPSAFDGYSSMQKTQFLEMKTLLAGYLLSSQGDRMSMAHSVEARYPFLDKDVIALFAQMPDELKLKELDEKFVLKEAFRDLLPTSITQRNKQPYRAPESLATLSDDMRARYLCTEALEKVDVFEPRHVEKLCDKLAMANETNQFSFGDNFAFNCILSTQIFHENFIQTAQPLTQRKTSTATERTYIQ